MPMYQTYGDAILQFFINYKSDFQQGFMFGVDEDTPKVKVLESLMRTNGFFFMKRMQNHKAINYVNQALI